MLSKPKVSQIAIPTKLETERSCRPPRQQSRQRSWSSAWPTRRRTHTALLHCWARSVPRQAARARSVHLYHLKAQRQAPVTTRQSGVRLCLPVKKKRQCHMKQRLTSSARSSSSHLPRPSSSTRWKAVSRRLEQARMSRQTFASPFVMAGMLAWLAGGRMIDLIIPDTPSWAKGPAKPCGDSLALRLHIALCGRRAACTVARDDGAAPDGEWCVCSCW
jgi:hypothetical protein